jgi:hypothetical protein
MSDKSWITRSLMIFSLFFISSDAFILGTEVSDANNGAETSDTAEPINTFNVGDRGRRMQVASSAT